MSLGVFVIRRLQDDVRLSAAGEEYKKKYIWQSLKDWKTWAASECMLYLEWTILLPYRSVYVRRIVSA